MTTLTFIFYAMFCIFTIWEVYELGDMPARLKMAASIRDTIKRKGTLTKKEGQFLIFEMFYFAWVVAGLFTHEWPFFAGIVVLSIISSILLQKKKLTLSWLEVDALLSVLLLVAIPVFKYIIHYEFPKIWHVFS
jgi:hypothetical protein